MEQNVNALPPEGGAKPAPMPPQTAGKHYDVTDQDRRLLLGTAAFCVLLAHTFLWCGPGAGLTAAVFAWYVLVLASVGTAPLAARSNRVLLVVNLLLAATFALGSNRFFRVWNCLALLVLLPVHALALSGAGRLPWHRPAMLWERLCLLLIGLFGNLGAGPAALCAGRERRDGRRILAAALGLGGAVVLVCVLLPVLAWADALFAAVTETLRTWIWDHLPTGVWQVGLGLAMTPFFFSFLYALRRPEPLKTAWKESSPTLDPLPPAIVLGALDGLYLLFLGVQSAGLFGGPEYLARRGISYAEWARSGFFQMVGITVLNLTVMLAALSLCRREGALWRTVRVLAGLLTAESLVLLASAAWRMTLYVSAYGLSFKRLLTYWGMGMLAILLILTVRKVWRREFRFFRAAAPIALAGWLLLNYCNVDAVAARYNAAQASAGRLPQSAVDDLVYGSFSCDGLRFMGETGNTRWLRTEAARDCESWTTWSVSAFLAAKK